MKNIFIIAILFLAISASMSAKKITGTVYGKDADLKKTPLKNASVFVLGEKNGTLTNKDGRFEININDHGHDHGHSLVVSYTGYKRDTIPDEEIKDNMEIVLELNASTKEVKVYGDEPGQVISKIDPIKVEKITSAGLKKAACCNLAESFQTSPSVDVEYSDAVSGAKRIQLLGLAGVYSQMLAEKVPTLRGIGAAYGLAYVPGPWMESIQVSKGSASVTTGYESMTGQINIDYKKPEKHNPTFINIYGDDNGRGEINIDHTMEVTDELSTMLMVHGNYFGSEIDHNDDKFIDKPMVKQLNLFNRWKYQGEHYESVTGIKGLYEDRQGGQKGYSDDKQNLYGIDVVTRRYEFFTKNGYIFNDEPFSSLGTIVSASHHKQNSNFGKRDYDAEQNSFYTNILFQNELGHEGHSMTSGFSYQYDNYLEHIDTLNNNHYESVPGVYTEYTYSGIEGLTLLGGIRADFHNKYKTFITPRFHLKWAVSDETTIRASAGKGFRSPHVYMENTGLLATSRDIIVPNNLKEESAWNYGLNASTTFDLLGITWNWNTEYYRTQFDNQVILDLDTDPSKAIFANLDGESYSNSFQIDVNFEPIKRFTVTAAYRLNDVKQTINGKLEDKPLQSRHKGFLNLVYDTKDKGWSFDFTAEYNGGGRLPNTSANPEEFRLKEDFPSFVLLYAQITKKFEGFEIYIGGENLTDYVQHHPILSAKDPFGKYFDSSIIWGPVIGRMFYGGIRLSIDHSH